ncbi:hypothetical protein [Pseudomonas sp. Pseusp16]|uniref:hypothetical protein n=1 Tax=Pseudomonas sp. Pseusp16 TaxID=3243021 RepID=UPI0039B5B38B
MTNPVAIELTLDFDNWTASPKSKLELILEQSTHEEKSILPRLEDYPEYKHLILLDIEDAANEVLDLVIKRYIMLRRTLSDENKTKLDVVFKESISTNTDNDKELRDKLRPIFGNGKIAAFHHIKNSCSSIFYSISRYEQLGIDAGVKLLCAGLYELYLGEQRFFNEDVKTRSEIAKEGGIARQNRHLATKQKACELLDTLTPTNGWTQDLDAYKAILPEIEKYMKENNIRNPTKDNIKRTLRHWIKRDPLVSAAVRITQPST